MIEVNMPQDIMKYKTKFIGNFSMRETICVAAGFVAGLTGWFSLFTGLTGYPKMILTALLALPFFMAGFFKPLGMPAEKALTTIFVDNFIAPAKRRYEVHHTEYEKFLKYPDIECLDNQDENKSKKKTNQKTLAQTKVKPSKQYKGIR